MTTENFHKDVFERISNNKRKRIFESAMHEFASQGYDSANINTIAEHADISIGAMYTYFPSKENLYLAISELGVNIYREIVAKLQEEEGFFATVERLFQLAIDYARTHKNISQMYLELTTEQMSGIAGRLAEKLEMDFREFYMDLLMKARDKGEIRPDVDLGFAAKLLDDCVLSLQMGASVFYYKERQGQYLGNISDDKLIDRTSDLVRRYLSV